MRVAVIIPFRDRGVDPLRRKNLERVLAHWERYAYTVVADDGREGGAQFNRSAAYNRGVRWVDAEVYIFAESDMLIRYSQVDEAVAEAHAEPGLVVPFSEYRYLSEFDSRGVRVGITNPERCVPESTLDNGQSIGALNVLSHNTFQMVGRYDESFEGSWYDDNAMHRAFDICAGPTRWVAGPAHHLYHLPGWTGDHLTKEDKAATERNRQRYKRYLAAKTPQEIRALTLGLSSQLAK